MWQALREIMQRPAALRARGVLGMNERNLEAIGRHNPRHLFPLVDDKLKTKLLSHDYELATPQLLGVIRHQADIRRLPKLVAGATDGFAIKPAKGSGGKGILVIQSLQDGLYVKASGERLSQQAVEHHLSNLLSGLYSLSGNPDVAIIERRIISAPVFNDYTFEGVPDIRVIVYKGYPIMAMMRLSTHASDGKANLHQGAIGVGIDLNTGKALRAVQHDHPVTHHPDTGKELASLQIDNWHRLLQLAARCYDMTGLGYLGADLVIDADQGPLLLELNARPGLAIQLANGKGLQPRLQRIDQHCRQIKGPGLPHEQRVATALQLLQSL